jgi:hypothetical protein
MKNITRKIQTTVILITVISFSVSGQTWNNVGTGISGYGRVEAMCEYNGYLYVGGYFDNIGGLQVKSLARWNGTAWDSVPGMTGFGDLEIFDMTVYNNDLVIVGNAIHKWNGTSWSNVGGWVDNRQFAVEVYNSELYIAGHFEHAAGIPTRGIAKWNGVTWDSVGGAGLNLSAGFTGSALNVYNGKLYIGGNFYQASGVHASCIASWDGNNWDSVGVNHAGIAWQSLATYDNKLYGGGGMMINYSPNMIYFGSWNDTTWSSVNGGLNYIPAALTEYNNELYTAGDFDTAGNIQSYGIARWNNSTWDSVGSGLDLFHIHQDTITIFSDTMYIPLEHIIVMCTYNNELYVGGTFTMIGGINASCIARWHILGASINESQNSFNASIYPNPITDKLTVNIDNNEPSQITLYDISSRKLLQQTFTNTTTINTEQLAKGIYLYQVRNKNGIIKNGKVIKQ